MNNEEATGIKRLLKTLGDELWCYNGTTVATLRCRCASFGNTMKQKDFKNIDTSENRHTYSILNSSFLIINY